MVEDHPDVLRASKITIDVENKPMFRPVQKGRAPNKQIYNQVCKLSRSQVYADFALKLRCIPSGGKHGKDSTWT